MKRIIVMAFISLLLAACSDEPSSSTSNEISDDMFMDTIEIMDITDEVFEQKEMPDEEDKQFINDYIDKYKDNEGKSSGVYVKAKELIDTHKKVMEECDDWPDESCDIKYMDKKKEMLDTQSELLDVME